MTTTTDASTTADRYFEGWNDTDPTSRLAAVARAWSPEGCLGEGGRPVDVRGFFGSGGA
jgi:hypothetical protein